MGKWAMGIILYPLSYDGLVKSPKLTTNVIPANPGSESGAGAGIQKYWTVTKALDPGFRRGDAFYETITYYP